MQGIVTRRPGCSSSRGPCEEMGRGANVLLSHADAAGSARLQAFEMRGGLK